MIRFGMLRPAARGLGLAIALVISGASPSGAADPARYGGIEVGSKGIKAVVVEVDPASGAVKTLMEGNTNTSLAQDVNKSGVFAADAIEETAEAVGKFASRIKDEFHVPTDRIALIGSSGLPKATNRDAMAQAVASAAGLPAMTILSPDQEVLYSIKGLFEAQADRDKALLVDIGSGNTKGGFLQGPGVVRFEVPLGSVTFENRASAEAAKDMKEFAETAAKLRDAELVPTLRKQVADHPELARRSEVVLTGGAAYAMATLLKPEQIQAETVLLTAQDIARYAELVHKPKIEAAGPPPGPGTPAEKEVRKVLDTFSSKNLIAGSEILSAQVTALQLEGKTLRFDRRGLMALIRGKVLEQVEADRKSSVKGEDPRPPTPTNDPGTLPTLPAPSKSLPGTSVK